MTLKLYLLAVLASNAQKVAEVMQCSSGSQGLLALGNQLPCWEEPLTT